MIYLGLTLVTSETLVKGVAGHSNLDFALVKFDVTSPFRSYRSYPKNMFFKGFFALFVFSLFFVWFLFFRRFLELRYFLDIIWIFFLQVFLVWILHVTRLSAQYCNILFFGPARRPNVNDQPCMVFS